MKKTLTIFTFLILIISFKSQAQDDVRLIKSYIGISGGISVPEGNFAKADYNNNSAGFAKKGVTIALDGTYYFYKNLGIGATFSFQDQGELTGTDAQNLSNGYNASFLKESTNSTTSGRYHNAFLLVGPQYSFIIKKFTIDLRASAGAIKSFSTPTVAIVFDDSATTGVEPNQKSSTATAFAYGGNLGLRYSLTDGLDLALKFNYVQSDGLNIQIVSDPGTTGRFVTKQPITVVQSTLGLIIHL